MKRVTMTCLVLMFAGSLAMAAEPRTPPHHGKTKEQRDWLRRHLNADMQAVNTFPKEACGEMHRMVAYATPAEIDLLADCYYLTRKIAEAELREIAQAQVARALAQGGQLQAALPQEDERMKADREELRKLYAELARARMPARKLGAYIAGVPLGTDPFPVMPKGNAPGQNGAVPRGTNPHPVMPRSAAALLAPSAASRFGSFPGSGIQGRAATSRGWGR